ncbi:MAG: penicillin-binding protein 2 [Atopobiaceae bacterium]|nr:penicillin-binding protein 2 [Atopobiaceae bacterium]
MRDRSRQRRSDWDVETTVASSYDEDSRARYRMRSARLGGSGSGGFDNGIDVVFLVMLGLFALVALRLVWLQVISSRNLSEAAEYSRTDEMTLRARRGTIYDRNGNVLAISVDCKTIYCNPTEIEDPGTVASLLAERLGGERKEYLDKLRADTTFIYIERAVDEDKAEALMADLEEKEIRGIYFVDDSKRSYPYGNVGGQVLGIVGIDGDGLSGLELYYDDILRGTDGVMVMEKGIGGTPIAGATATVVEAKNGTDIVISLDVDVQMVAEEKITAAVKDFQAESGTVMVTDPKTGEILAACSTPLLPVSDFSQMEEGSETLKPVSYSYEPGSIFKVLTSAIGIENNLVTPWTTYVVPARVEVGDDLVGDDDGRDYTMSMTLTEMLRRSSNTGLAMVAQDSIGSEVFAAGVDAFGIGHATGIDFPGEEVGIVRPLEEYDGSTTGSMAFGQGLAIPMVQMVRAVGAIANGGYPCTPHFLVHKGGAEVEWPVGEQIVSKETCDQVIEMMRVVVESGTAVHAQVPGYEVAGKTGTGEQASETGGYLENAFMSSLVGFAPASDPEVLVYVGLNGTPYLAYGSAAPTFSSIMSETLNDMGVLPEY